MVSSEEKINYVTEYLTNYSSHLSALNKLGLTDAAVLFEQFAEKISTLWFDQSFHNLNVSKANYPYVDLISDNGQIFVQVSTVLDIPTKIRKTLENIKNAAEGNDEKANAANKITSIYFFVTENESLRRVKDYTSTSRIGNVDFRQSDNLISFPKLEERAKNDAHFCDELYSFLFNNTHDFEDISKKLDVCVSRSKMLLNDTIDSLINHEYEIDRSDIINTIKSDDAKFISIQGGPGSGKSVLCKKLLENEDIILFARAEKIAEVSDVNDIWNINLRKLLFFLNGRRVFFYIDALEFIADLSQTKYDMLFEIYAIASKVSKCYIVTSCRTSEAGSFIRLDELYKIKEYEISDLADEDITSIGDKYPVIKKMSAIKSYAVLVRNPFYVNLIVSNVPSIDTISDVNDLRNFIWTEIICSNNLSSRNYEGLGSSTILQKVNRHNIKKTVEYIAFTRAKNFTVGVPIDSVESDALEVLVSNDIVVVNDDKVRLKYDIFEDICFEQKIDSLFDEARGNLVMFFTSVKDLGKCAYRRYQIWVENKLFQRGDRDKFLYKILSSDKESNIVCKDDEYKKSEDILQETLIGIVKSKYAVSLFKENSDLIINDKLSDFLRTVNTYAFQPKVLDVHFGNIYTSLLPVGVGRPQLIILIRDNNVFEKYGYCTELRDNLTVLEKKEDHEHFDLKDLLRKDSTLYLIRNEIIRLCADYSRTDENSLDEKAANASCEILEFYIKDYYEYVERVDTLAKSHRIQYYYSVAKSEEVIRCLEPVYRLAKYSEAWIEKYWGSILLKKQKETYHLDHLSEDILENIIKSNVVQLAKYIPVQVCRIASAYWLKKEEPINESSRIDNLQEHERRQLFAQMYGYDYDHISKEALYGLTREAADYGSYFSRLDQNHLFWNLTVYNCNYALGWLIDATNHAAENIKKNRPDSVSVVTLSDGDGNKHEYIGNQDFWLAGNVKSTVPELLGDTLYIFTKIIVNTIKGIGSTGSSEISKEIARAIKNAILTRANNIMMLSVIEAIGMQCFKELPGYAIELCSSIDLIYFDIWRSVKLNPDATSRLLTKQMLQTMNMTEDMLGEYEIDHARQITLQEYALRSQLYDEGTKNRLWSILDELYDQFPNDKEYAEENLQIRKMDLRDAAYQQFSNCISVTPRITGEAKKIVDEAAKGQSVDGKKEIEQFLKNLDYGDEIQNLTTDELVDKINYLIELRGKIPVKDMVNSILVSMIACVLSRKDLDDNLRNKYCQFWINGLNELIDHGGFTFPSELSYVLFRQSEMNLSVTVDNFLRVTCFRYLTSDRIGNGVVSSIADVLKKYLDTNEDLASHLFNTIIASIQDDKLSDDGEGTKAILEKYLYSDQIWKEEIIVDSENISDLCCAVNCGLKLTNDDFYRFVDDLTKYVILNLDSRDNEYRRVISVDAEFDLREFFNRKIIKDNESKLALDILFDNIDFKAVKSNAIKFYFGCVRNLLPLFFDAKNDQNLRRKYERIVRNLEKKILSIQEEWQRNELTKLLFISVEEYHGRDWNQLEAKYSLRDKMFLNDMWSKYGKYHPSELFFLINQMHISELLPEVLLPVRDTLQSLNSEGEDKLSNIVNSSNTSVYINEIMSKALVDFNDEIRKDNAIATAYEESLELLNKVRFEGAGVLLDEFRYH